MDVSSTKFLPKMFSWIFSKKNLALRKITLKAVFVELILEGNSESFEILMAELCDLGYDSFMEEEQNLKAYITAEKFNEEAIKMLQIEYANFYPFNYKYQYLQKTNWNANWEKNYNPVEIANKVRIRATFHEPQPEKFIYEITITPKMSFGTGHHATTTLMIENQLEINHKDKKVLDVGCGTGILAIMAKLLGAKYVEAIDIDEWAVENCKENCQINHCFDIQVYQTDVRNMPYKQEFDIILANINKNVLLNEIPIYRNLLIEKGFLIVSGFYEDDLSGIEQKCRENYMYLQKIREKNQWISAVFQKS